MTAKRTKKKPAKMRIGRLDTADSILRLLSKVTKSALRGGISYADAYKVGCLGGVLLKAVEVASLERRITILEQRSRVQ